MKTMYVIDYGLNIYEVFPKKRKLNGRAYYESADRSYNIFLDCVKRKGRTKESVTPYFLLEDGTIGDFNKTYLTKNVYGIVIGGRELRKVQKAIAKRKAKDGR